MLTLSLLKENKDLVISGLKKKFVADPEVQVDQILAVDSQRRSVQFELDGILADSNQKAKLIGELMKNGKKEEAEKLKTDAAAARDTSKNLQDKLNELEKDVQSLLVKLPNLPHHSVPEGRTPEENIVVLEKGDKPSLSDKALPHWDLIKKYDIIDFELGNKITGAGFPVYKNKGARLQRAMINFFLDEAVKAGKVAPATKEFYVGLCMQEGGADKFKEFLSKQPVVVATGSEAPTGAPTGAVALNAETKKVAGLLGVSEEDLKKYSPAAA